MTTTRPPTLLLLSAALLGAAVSGCAEDVVGARPPGLDGGVPRLFYPVAARVVGSTLVIANGNFDRAYSSGSVVQWPLSAWEPQDDARTPVTVPSTAPVAALDAFAGEMVQSAAGDALFVTTRGADQLLRIPLDGAGQLACPDQDCSADGVALGGVGMLDPFSLRRTMAVANGGSTPEPALVVGHLSPSSDQKAWAAIVPERLVRRDARPFEQGARQVELGVAGTGALDVDPRTGEALFGGCYLRVTGGSVVSCSTDPSSALSSANILRSFSIFGDGAVSTQSLGPLTGGGDTADVALSAQVPGRAYVATTRPAQLLVIDRSPLDRIPRLRAAVPLAGLPSRIALLPTPTTERLAVSVGRANLVLVVDPDRAAVVAQVQTGQTPFALEPRRPPGGTATELYVTLFNDCGVARIDVPDNAPENTALRATVGRCGAP